MLEVQTVLLKAAGLPGCETSLWLVFILLQHHIHFVFVVHREEPFDH